jgi:hypothetical protein
MPKTKRDLLKRQLAHAYANCHRAVNHLSLLHDAFKDVHPELGDSLETAIMSIVLGADIIEKFANEAWAIEPEELVQWRNVRDMEG